jgi:hypothetical protein
MTEEDVPIVADIIRRAVDAAVHDERLERELALAHALRPLGERLAAVEARPPLPGPPGENGLPGPPGAPGRDGVDGKAGLVYCGVYVEGRTYERGDGVTWGGSFWHCNAEATTTKPGDAAKDWTLMVKRGRDGKDGRA